MVSCEKGKKEEERERERGEKITIQSRLYSWFGNL